MIRDKIERYMINLSLTYEELGENIWLVEDPEKGLGHVFVYADDPLVTLRAKVMDLPEKERETFFEELLRLNNEMIHGAYALEQNNVVLVDTLESETMDLEEFRASLEAIGLALAQHYPRLSQYL
jgi:hypothetical protein